MKKRKTCRVRNSYVVKVIIWLLAHFWSHERQRREALVKMSFSFL